MTYDASGMAPRGLATGVTSSVDGRILGSGEGCVDDASVSEAGRRARGEAIGIDRYANALRLASFRRYAHATVRSMSALLPDVLSMIGSDAESMLDMIRPDQSWPGATAYETPRDPLHRGRLPSGRAARRWRTGDPHFDNHVMPLRMGGGRISDDRSGNSVEVAIAGGSIDFKLCTKMFELSSAGDMVRITLEGRLPATIVAACSGEPLDDLLNLPLTNGRGYLVNGVSRDGLKLAIEFTTGRLGISMPWG